MILTGKKSFFCAIPPASLLLEHLRPHNINVEILSGLGFFSNLYRGEPVVKAKVMPSDEELMLAVCKGDLNAFGEIVFRHQHSAWNIAYRFLGNETDAEDVAQEAFLKLLDAARRYRPTALFRTYLHRIVTHLCLDRATKKQPIYTDQQLETPDPAATASEKLISIERDLAVRKTLDKLPCNQRMAIVLKYYEGLG